MEGIAVLSVNGFLLLLLFKRILLSECHRGS